MTEIISVCLRGQVLIHPHLNLLQWSVPSRGTINHGVLFTHNYTLFHHLMSQSLFLFNLLMNTNALFQNVVNYLRRQDFKASYVFQKADIIIMLPAKTLSFSIAWLCPKLQLLILIPFQLLEKHILYSVNLCMNVVQMNYNCYVVMLSHVVK